MLRKLREQWWYLLFWMPLCTALGLLAVWFWIVFHIIGGWTIEYDAAPKWGCLSAVTWVLFVLCLILLFPRKPARSIGVAAASVGLVTLVLSLLFFANTTVISYEVRDVVGGPLENIPVHIRHHANGVALTWFPGETVLYTDKEGKASIRIFKSEGCDANVNDRLGQPPGFGNPSYSEDNAFFTPASTENKSVAGPFGGRAIVEHSYMLEFHGRLPFIPQRCLEPPLSSGPGVIRVYLRRNGSASLPPYFDRIVNEKSDDPAVKTARLMSLGGSIEGINHLDELLSVISRDDSQQDAAMYSLDQLALQIRATLEPLSGLSLEGNIPHERYLATNDERQKCSQTLYLWLSGDKSPPPLSHVDRIAYIRQRLDQAALALIEGLHPLMLKKKSAFDVLQQLQQDARPALKYYPEVFEKGTPEAREGALASIGQIAPSAQDIAFLLRSKNPAWIQSASAITFNSTADELSDDLKTLESLRAQESDAQNIAAFDQLIGSVKTQLAQDQASEADIPSSTVEPRYVVIDLGTKMLHPKKITNSGYVLGCDDSSNYYVWIDGVLTALQPKNAGDKLSVDAIDESGTVVGSETSFSEGAHHSVYRATWGKGASTPQLAASSQPVLPNDKPDIRDKIRALNLPQIAGSPVVPQALNAALAPLPRTDDQPVTDTRLVAANQVIGNGPEGGYLWEMTPTLSMTKTFEGPYPINILLPGEPKVSPWNVKSVADINDGGSVVGNAIYMPNGPDDSMAAGLHGVVLMPLAIVREVVIGSGVYGPIVDNGLDDRATIPIFGSAPPGTPNASTPETDGQGIFYIEMPGSIPASITLRCGDNHVTVQATPVKGRPNLLRTGKLVLIEKGDPFRASDITTIEEGTSPDGRDSNLELQKYGRTLVK